MRYFDEVRINDKVWDLIHGWGHVCIIDREGGDIRRMVVQFNDGEKYAYWPEGREYSSDTFSRQRLFWDEVKIVPPPRPKRKIKKTIWVNVYSSPKDLTGLRIGLPHSNKESAEANRNLYDAYIATRAIEVEMEE
jgi:hypothetical protein